MNLTREFHCYVGKKGSGKTSSLMDDLCEIAAHTEMQIVGNPPIIYEGFAGYMRDKYGLDKSWHDRLTIGLTRDQLRHFWVYFGQGWQIPYVSPEMWKRGIRYSWEIAYRWLPTDKQAVRLPLERYGVKELNEMVDSGEVEWKDTRELPAVCYVIDEIGAIYRAREHLDYVPGLEDYLDQQRKLSQEVIATTVKVEKVDKCVRDMVDNWHVCVNWGKKRKSIMRLPAVFTQTEFDQIPAKGINAVTTNYRKLDLQGLLKTYDTSEGVGIGGGRKSDVGAKPRGLSPYWLVVLAVAFVFLAFNARKAFAFVVNRVVPKTADSVPKRVPSAPDKASVVQVGPNPQAATVAALTPNFTAPGKPAGPAAALKPAAQRVPKKLTGVVVFNGWPTAYFSDGSVLDPGSKDWRGLLKRNGRYLGVITADEGEMWVGN